MSYTVTLTHQAEMRARDGSPRLRGLGIVAAAHGNDTGWEFGNRLINNYNQNVTSASRSKCN